MAGAKIIGAEALKRELEAIGREAREKLPGVAARALASASIESFRNAALRPVPWPPLAASTLGRAGAASAGAANARKKASDFRKAALEAASAAECKTGKSLEKALAKAAMEDALKAMVKSE